MNYLSIVKYLYHVDQNKKDLFLGNRSFSRQHHFAFPTFAPRGLHWFHWLFFIIGIQGAFTISFASDSTASVQRSDSVTLIAPAQTPDPGTAVQPEQGFRHAIAPTTMKAIFGAGAGAAGALFCGMVGAGIEKGFRGDGFLSGLSGFVIGAPIGYLFSEPAGVCLGGHLFEQEGSYWGAFLGNAAGCALGAGLIALTTAVIPKSKTIGPIPGEIVMIAFPISGSILGYYHLLKPRRRPGE
jgi:hypothetical protein